MVNRNNLEDLSTYWSANFFAFVGFICFLFSIILSIYGEYGLESIINLINPLYFFSNFVCAFLLYPSLLLGISYLIAVISLSIAFIFYLITKNKKHFYYISLYLSLFLLVLCIIYLIYKQHQGGAVTLHVVDINSVPNMVDFNLIISIISPLLVIINKISNNNFFTDVLNNRVHKIFISIFFYYFWIAYILFGIYLYIFY